MNIKYSNTKKKNPHYLSSIHNPVLLLNHSPTHCPPHFLSLHKRKWWLGQESFSEVLQLRDISSQSTLIWARTT